MIPLKSSLKRNYRCFQKIVAPSQLAQPEQPKGEAASVGHCVGCISTPSLAARTLEAGEAEDCNRGYLPHHSQEAERKRQTL